MRVREKLLKFHVTDKEDKDIRDKAKSANMGIERFLRNSALKSNIVIYDWSSIFELSTQVSRIGNNINQIARKLNQGDGIYNNDINFLKETMSSINEVLLKIHYDLIETSEED